MAISSLQAAGLATMQALHGDYFWCSAHPGIPCGPSSTRLGICHDAADPFLPAPRLGVSAELHQSGPAQQAGNSTKEVLTKAPAVPEGTHALREVPEQVVEAKGFNAVADRGRVCSQEAGCHGAQGLVDLPIALHSQKRQL